VATPSTSRPRSVLDYALSYAALGLHVLPVHVMHNGDCTCPPTSGTREHGRCKSPGKHPVHDAWQTIATTDEAKLRKWFANGLANVGVLCGKSRIVTVDIDPRNKGRETFAQLEAELGPLPATVAADTGGGGEHRVFRRPAGDLVGKLGDGVDLLRDARQFLVEPSLHPSGGRYTWQAGRAPGEIQIAELPEAWIHRASRKPSLTPAPTHWSSSDEITLKRARGYLGTMKVSVSGQDGHGSLWSATCRLMHGFGLDDITVRHLLVEVFNPRCQPPWSDRDIDHKIKQARNGAEAERWRVENRERERVSYRDPPPPVGMSDEDAFADRDEEPAVPDATDGVKHKPISVLAVDAARVETPPIRSYSTGNLTLDNLLAGGINTRELCVVMGPPGGCKTAWAVSTAAHIQRSIPVLYASTELEQHELMARFAANVLGRSWAGIRRGAVPREIYAGALEGVAVRLIGCDLLPRDGAKALQVIEDEARWMAHEHKQPALVIVDYLQDLARGAERDVRSRIGDYASLFRSMSQRLDCPIIAVSSVSRTYYSIGKAAEFREADDASVYLAAAKESGDVDFAAARVIFLDAEDDRDKPERAVRIAVAKSRDGRVGFAGARVVPESGRFMPAPEVVDEMSAPGRSTDTQSESASGDDQVVLQRVVREHSNGNGDLCTKNYLRTGNGIGKERAENALERLARAGRIGLRTLERSEGGRLKSRLVYEPIGGP
jgi:archaellum biogenesis ATPase FlaH